MIKKALRSFIAPEGSAHPNGFEIGYAPLRRDTGIFSRFAPVRLRAYLFLDTDEIAFARYTAALRSVAKEPLKPKNIRCLWFVVSEKGSIYLHEALEDEAASRPDGMRHRFIVLGANGGTVSLGPGDAQNLPLGERLRFLVSESRRMSEDSFLRETAKVFAACADGRE